MQTQENLSAEQNYKRPAKAKIPQNIFLDDFLGEFKLASFY